MKYVGKKVEDIKIAYIGGGSQGWAWGLMSDLVAADDISGKVALYDINMEAAKKNVVIGTMYNNAEGAKSHWDYEATETLGEALTGADFVVISITPATMKEMESDVHAPEKYGIYQSVGDTMGPGGVLRAMRCIPMIEEIARGVEKYCPNAWVINYTNPMTVCVRTLYKTFPGIKAFGCCHEVFGTQKLLSAMLEDMHGIEGVPREDIHVEVTGVNHFTWLTAANYKDIDLFEEYKTFAEKYREEGFQKGKDDNWMNNIIGDCAHKVKFDLFLKYGYMAAAGDRHLAEFVNGKIYLENPDVVKSWLFGLTPVSWRYGMYDRRAKKSAAMISGEEPVEIKQTGEDGVNQIRALLGLHDMITNVNLPNRGQIANLPMDVVVETNATFRTDKVTPVTAGPLPESIYPLIKRVVDEQENMVAAGMERSLEKSFEVFVSDALTTISREDAKVLFDEMVDNTKAYLGEYFK